MDFTGQGLVGVNVDKINMVPNVAAGRVPACSAADLSTYLKKVTDYEFAARQSNWANNPSSWFKNALVVVDGDPNPFGDETLAEQYAAPLAAAGVSLIRRFKDNPPWSTATDVVRAAELRGLLDAGAGFLYFFGHGNRTNFSQWFSAADVAQSHNELRLPVVFAVACLTGEFLDIDSYLTATGSDWTGGAGPRPEPAPVQPEKYERDTMAVEFLVKGSSGAVAYIGATSKFEHGGKPLMQYFSEAYRDLPKPPALGEVWRRALTQFAQKDALKGMDWYAFLHLHKVMLFGDPSLRIGGLQPGFDLSPSPWVEMEPATLDQAAAG